jgi:branched-chain amino acid transport system substrate-binding protein
LDRRQALKLLAALGTAGLAGACSTRDSGVGYEEEAQADLSPVKIGMIAPRAGGYKPIGDDLVNGFQLYLSINNNRLAGHPVELVIADEGESTDSGRAAVDSLLKQGVLALTGVVNSAVMIGIRDMVEQAQVPLVGSNASPFNLQSVVYIWRTSYRNDEPGMALGPYVDRFLRDKYKGAGRVALMSPKTTAGEDALRGFRETFAGGSADKRLLKPIWTTTDFDPPPEAFKAPIAELMKTNPEAVFCFFAGGAAVQFLRQVRDAGYKGQIFGSGFLTEGSVLSSLKPEEVEGVLTALNYSPDLNNAANRQFASAFRKLHGVPPTTYAMASYDAAQVLDKAIRLAPERPTPKDVNLALGKIGQVDSPRGSWQFNQPRTPQQRWYLRRVQRDGQAMSNVLISELVTLG